MVERLDEQIEEMLQATGTFGRRDRDTTRDTPISKRALRDVSAAAGTYRFFLPPAAGLPHIDSPSESIAPEELNLAAKAETDRDPENSEVDTTEETPDSLTPEQLVLENQADTKVSILKQMARFGYASIPPESDDHDK